MIRNNDLPIELGTYQLIYTGNDRNRHEIFSVKEFMPSNTCNVEIKLALYVFEDVLEEITSGKDKAREFSSALSYYCNDSTFNMTCFYDPDCGNVAFENMPTVYNMETGDYVPISAMFLKNCRWEKIEKSAVLTDKLTNLIRESVCEVCQEYYDGRCRKPEKYRLICEEQFKEKAKQFISDM